MYDLLETQLIEAGVAMRLDEPVWMDEWGEMCEEKNAYGCKTDLKITNPEMCIVADEVGANTSQKGDGRVGGQKVCLHTWNNAKDEVES